MSTSPLLRARLELLHDAARHFGGLGLDEQVKMFGHQNPAKQKEAELVPKLIQDCKKVAAKSISFEHPGAAIDAAREKLQLARSEVALARRHGRG